MRIYIAGPMTGLPEFNYPAFHTAAERLTERGFDPINPARTEVREHCRTWLDYMRASLHDLAACDAVATLPGWGESRGAALEVHIARSLELPVRSVMSWLTTGPGDFTTFEFTAEPVAQIREGDVVVIHDRHKVTRSRVGPPQGRDRLYPLHVVPEEDTNDHR